MLNLKFKLSEFKPRTVCTKSWDSVMIASNVLSVALPVSKHSI